MADTPHCLSFERPIYDLEARIQKLDSTPNADARNARMKFAACGGS